MKTPIIDKRKAIAWAGGTSIALAAKLGVSRQAVGLWGNKIPQGRRWQLYVLGCPTEPAEGPTAPAEERAE